MKARLKDMGEIIELAEEGIISSDGRRFCWYQVELISEPIDGESPKVDLVARLKHHLATTPKEQLEKRMERIRALE